MSSVNTAEVVLNQGFATRSFVMIMPSHLTLHSQLSTRMCLKLIDREKWCIGEVWVACFSANMRIMQKQVRNWGLHMQVVLETGRWQL